VLAYDSLGYPSNFPHDAMGLSALQISHSECARQARQRVTKKLWAKRVSRTSTTGKSLQGPSPGSGEPSIIALSPASVGIACIFGPRSFLSSLTAHSTRLYFRLVGKETAASLGISLMQYSHH
jgi:methionine synthase I (cobalamin-dependent)